MFALNPALARFRRRAARRYRRARRRRQAGGPPGGGRCVGRASGRVRRSGAGPWSTSCQSCWGRIARIPGRSGDGARVPENGIGNKPVRTPRSEYWDSPANRRYAVPSLQSKRTAGRSRRRFSASCAMSRTISPAGRAEPIRPAETPALTPATARLASSCPAATSACSSSRCAGISASCPFHRSMNWLRNTRSGLLAGNGN